MSKTSESGHAKNMTNLESLISAITLFGEKYNPSKESIKLTSLQALLVSTKESFNAHYAAQTAYSKAVDNREIAFEPLSKLITRINNALKASDSNMKYDESVQSKTSTAFSFNSLPFPNMLPTKMNSKSVLYNHYLQFLE